MGLENGNRGSARLSRRGLIRGGLVIGGGLAGAALIGCSSTSKPAPSGGSSTPAASSTQATSREGVPVAKGTPKDGGTWTEAVSLTSPQQDMHTALAQSIWHNISERAFQPDPWTGEKWETPDSTTIVMHVKKGVLIHDKAPWSGREFDAEDLAFNINRIAGNTAEAEGIQKTQFQRADTLAGMSKVEVVDKHTVKVTMARPSSAYLMGFLEWRNVMMPKGIVEVGFKDPMKFASFGAYQMSEFVPDVRETFVKHPKYYRQGEPHIEKFQHTVVGDRAAALAGFISKQFSILASPTPQEEQTVKAARPDAMLYSTAGNQWLYLWPSANSEALKDFRVRKAMQLAINYQEMGSFYGTSFEYTSPVFSGFVEGWKPEKIKTLAGYNPATKAKDLTDALALLSAAGRAEGEGIAFPILTPTGTGIFAAHNEDAIRFQAQMQKAFPKSKITVNGVADRAQFAATQAARRFDMLSYSSIPQPAAASEAYSLFHSKGGRNYGNFSNPEADSLLEKAQQELDAKARTQIFETFQQKWFSEWMPLFALYVEPKKAFIQPNISGYENMVGPWSQGLSFHRRGLLSLTA